MPKLKSYVAKEQPATALETARRLGMTRTQVEKIVAFAKDVVQSSKRTVRPTPRAGRGIYTAPILVGLTPEQREIVKTAAKRKHRSVGEWARLVLVQQAERIEAREKAVM